MLKFNFSHQTCFHNFEAFKFPFIKNLKKYVKIDLVCILKVTEDFGTDPYPHPDGSESGPGSASGSLSQWYGSEDPHPDPYQNFTDPEH